MVKFDKYAKHEILELAFLVIYIVLVIGVFTLFAGFGLGGFSREEILNKANFYIPYGIIFLLGIIALKVVGIFVFGKKHAALEGVIVHDPPQTPLGKFKLFNRPFLLAYFSLIVFMLLGWWFSLTQTFFSDIPRYEQQFTTGADLFFSVYPASPSETLGAIFLIGLVGLILGWMVLKGKLGKIVAFVLFVISGTIASLLFGIINHQLRYGSSEVALANVAVFWTFGGLITTLTGSMIPFLILHDVNNFYFRLSKLFSSDIVTFITFTIITILIVLFLIVFIRAKKKKKNAEGT